MTKISDIVTKSRILQLSQEDLATLLITKLSLDKQEWRNLTTLFENDLNKITIINNYCVQ